MRRCLKASASSRWRRARRARVLPRGLWRRGAAACGGIGGELRIPRVLVPIAPGVTSALGLLLADQRHDYVRTALATVAPDQAKWDGSTVSGLNRRYAEMEAEARRSWRAKACRLRICGYCAWPMCAIKDKAMNSKCRSRRAKWRRRNWPTWSSDSIRRTRNNTATPTARSRPNGQPARDGAGRVPQPQRAPEPLDGESNPARAAKDSAMFVYRWIRPHRHL